MKSNQSNLSNQTTQTTVKKSKYNQMKKLENKLNGELGDAWWNKYISSAFWSNISTPINLAITILSAITAGQATTENMLSKDMFFKISLASLLISTLNTFFRPHSQLMTNMTTIKSINEFGAKFETIYYSDCGMEEDYERRYTAYTILSQELNKYQIEQSPEEQNFFTDFLYWICKKYSVLRNNYRWLDTDMIYMGEHKELTELSSGCCKSSCCIPNNKMLDNVVEPTSNQSTNQLTNSPNKMEIKLNEIDINSFSNNYIDLEKGCDK